MGSEGSLSVRDTLECDLAAATWESGSRFGRDLGFKAAGEEDAAQAGKETRH